MNEDHYDKCLDAYGARIRLEGRGDLLIRPLKRSDRNRLVGLFEQMSPHSISLRFMRPLNSLPESMIEKLLNIDYRSSCALVALVDRQGTDEIVSVGRYGDDPDEGAAELAVAVRDDWRGAGLGTIMLSKVVDMAKENGYTRFTGIMDPQNVAIRKVLAGLGYKVEYLVSGGVYKVNITI